MSDSAQAVDTTDDLDIIVQDESDDAGLPKDQFGFTDEDTEELAADMVRNVEDVEADEKRLRQRWIKWREQLDAVPRDRKQHNVLVNASNVSPPLAQINGQAMTASLQAYFTSDPFFAVTPLRDNDDLLEKEANVLTNYLQMLARSPADLNIFHARRIISLEAGVMGRCVVKVPYSHTEWRYKDTDPSTGLTSTQSVVYHDGPEIVAIPQEDVYYPKEWPDVYLMPWIIHQIRLPDYELKQRQADGIYENVDEVLGRVRNNSTPAERSADWVSGRDGKERHDIHEILECYFYYDADGDGYVEDHIWTIHRETRVVLRKEYNTLGRRPFVFFLYFERAHEKTGRGTGQICEVLQDEVEGIRDVRNDNMKIANMRMLRMTRAVQQQNGERIYPGKIWVTETENDIGTIQLGEVYPSSLEAENQVWSNAAQATGLSEVQRGFSDPVLGTRDTYRGQAMRIQQAKGMFSTIAEGIRSSYNELGMLILYQLVANKDKVIARERELQRLSPADLTILEAILNVDRHQLPAKFAFAVSSADLTETPDAIMQRNESMAQLYNTWAMQIQPLAMQLLSPQGMQMSQASPMLWLHEAAVYIGSTQFLQQILNESGIDNADEYLPDTTQMQQLVAMQKMIQAQRGMAGGLPPAEGGTLGQQPAAGPGGAGSSGPPQSPAGSAGGNGGSAGFGGMAPAQAPANPAPGGPGGAP